MEYKDKAIPEIMTVSEVAEYLQISEVTTYKLLHSGDIPSFKIGRSWRVKFEDLIIFIDKKKVECSL